ncbi:MAG: nitronate monooxygenase [Candidatus Falkowbacteria bacterium]
MINYKTLVIKDKKIPVPIIQGGMGVGVSRWLLAGATALAGGIGIISTAGLDRLVSQELGRKVDTYEAVFLEVVRAKKFSNNGLIGVNIMVFLQKDRDAAARGAIAAKADFIISGAGIPFELALIKDLGSTARIPIVSSVRVLNIIQSKWEKSGCRPDAIVLEGPLAGGHLGFKFDDVLKSENKLENLLPLVKDFAMKNGDYPVIVAGGIYDSSDIQRFMALGADGVQMGTRFLATEESGASERYKQAVVDSKEDTIVVVKNSPCGFPFRTLVDSPMYQQLLSDRRKNVCDKGYLLQKDKEGNNTFCPAKDNSKDYFCICNGLLSSAGYSDGVDLYTVGSSAHRIKEVVSVKKLMDELRGI